MDNDSPKNGFAEKYRFLTYADESDTVYDGSKIADGSVTTDKLANYAVTTNKIDDESITTVKLDDGIITLSKLASDVTDAINDFPTVGNGLQLASDTLSAKIGAGLAFDANNAIELDGSGDIATAVSNWLTAHPEATTTVQDGSITDAKLVQTGGILETVSEIISSNKNLWTGDTSVSFTTSNAYQFDPPLPAGTYTLSAVVTSTDTDTTQSRFVINSGVTGAQSKDLNRNARNGATFISSVPVVSVTFYAAKGGSASTGDSATWADIQIETGSVATDYVAHKLTAVDLIARDRINNMNKYVSPDGNDSNDGNTKTTPYKTIAKAMAEANDAATIYIAPGTYDETLPRYLYKNTKIVGENAVLTCSNFSSGQIGILYFMYSHVEIIGISVIYQDGITAPSNCSGIALIECNGTVRDCESHGAPYMGFRLDGSKITLERCIASGAGVDGFNAHNLVAGYNSECSFFNCTAYDNVDDGLSLHETAKMYVSGGEFYNNGSTGIAAANTCEGEIKGAYIHDNGAGVECFNDAFSAGDTLPIIVLSGNIIKNNNKVDAGHDPLDIGYGIHAKAYEIDAVANAVVGHNQAAFAGDSNSVVNIYSITTS